MVGHDGVRDFKRNTGMVFLQILDTMITKSSLKSWLVDFYLQTNFQMKFASTGNDVLAGFGDPGLHARIRLGQTLETFDEFGQITCVLDFNSDLHDRRDGEP